MQSKAKTVDQYLAELPEDRREAIAAVRAAILKSLPKGYEEGIGYGMISYHVPHSLYPAGYHCDPKLPLPFASLASQKNHMALYLMCLYSDDGLESWFRDEWAKTGKKLDMGKSCIRFKKLDDLPLGLIGRVLRKVPVKKYVAHYEATLARTSKRKPKATKTTGKKAVAKKKVARKATSKKSSRPRG